MLIMAILCVLCIGSVSAANIVDSDISDDIQELSISNDIVVNDVSSVAEGDGSDSSVNEAENITIIAPNSTDVYFDDKKVNFEFDVKKGNESLNLTKDDLNLTLTYKVGNESNVTNITDYALGNKSISFILPDSIPKFDSASLLINYKETLANKTINVVPKDVIIIKDSNVDVNIDLQKVNFQVFVKPGVTLTKEDLKLILSYIESIPYKNGTNSTIYNNTTVAYNVTEFDVISCGNDTYNITFSVNNTQWGNWIKGNFTSANLNLTYKEEFNKTLTLKPIFDARIEILNNKSATQYQNAYIVAKIINTVTNKPIANRTIYFKLENATMGVQWGFTTDKNGECKVSLDYIYSLGQSFIPIGKNYVMIVKAGDNIVATGKNVTFNITKPNCNFTASNYKNYYGAVNNKFKITLKNSVSKTVLKYIKLKLVVKSGSSTIATLYTYTNGSGVANLGVNLGAGNYKIYVYGNDTNVSVKAIARNITVTKVKAIISANNISAYYNTTNFKVKMVRNGTNTPLANAAVLLNVYTGKKYKVVRLFTDEKGIARWTVNGVSLGKHITLVGSGSTSTSSCNVLAKTINVKKAVTTVKAPKVSNKYNTKSYFKVNVTNKVNKKQVAGLYLYLKVFTGKNYKLYKVKTNAKGIASFNTQKLTKGTHKVSIASANNYYTASGSSAIVIK